MSWWQQLLGINPSSPKATKASRVPLSARAVAGGRVSQDHAEDWLVGNWMVTPPEDFDEEWRLGNFDANTLSKITPARLTEILSDLSPEIGRALWDFMRLCNPGHELTAFRPASETAYPKAQKALDAFNERLNEQHGTVDVLYGRLFMDCFWRGAILTEFVADEAGRAPVDIAAPDPNCVRFRRRKDAVRGTVWELGQWQAGQWVSLDLPTVRYVPVDPALGSPYGRPMVSAALFTATFLLAMLHDLKRVVQQQGYPRLDISVDLEKMLDSSEEVAHDPVKVQDWANGIIAQVIAAYAQLEPDDAYVHSSSVTVNRPVGAVDASSLGAVDALIKALERMATRALKTMPLMMGLDQSTNEADSNRQWEIFAAGIKSIQHYVETTLERNYTLALECQGIQAKVVMRFAELRAAEELRDEQTRTMRINNARAEFEAGWTDNNEAARRGGIDHDAVLPGPRNSGSSQNQPVQDDGDGQERNGAQLEQRVEAAVERIETLLLNEKLMLNGHH